MAEITSDYGNYIGHADLHYAEDLDHPLAEAYYGEIFYGIYDASTRTIVTSPDFETDEGDYGVLKFTFNYGSEIIVPAGEKKTLVLELNTFGLVYGVQYGVQRVWVELLADDEKATLADDNFEWNDGEKDATGYLIHDLPAVGRVLYIE